MRTPFSCAFAISSGVQCSPAVAQPRRRAGDGSVFLRVDVLVAILVALLRRALDVRRQRHGAQFVQQSHKIARISEFYVAGPLFPMTRDFGPQFAVLAENNGISGVESTSRTHERLPDVPFEPSGQQKLDLCPGALLRAEQSGRQHLRVVEHEAVARIQVIQHVVEMFMFQRPGVSVDHEQTAAVPRFAGLLRDQLLGQIVIEIRYVHRKSARSPISVPS